MKNNFYIKDILKTAVIKTQYEWESHIENIFRIFNKDSYEFSPENLLDVGCGDGRRTVRIAEHFHIQRNSIHGIDYDDEAIQKCNLFFDSKKRDLENEKLPFKDCKFDLVICNQVLEHIKNYKHVIAEIIRVTKKEGFILLGIPNLAHLINRIYLLFGIQPLCLRVDSTHVRGFTHKAFLEMIKALKNVKLEGSAGSTIYPLPYFIAKFLSYYLIGLSGYTCYLLKKI
jgi:ubiquinone/menaquinone biosynthesis C-methylase UbiE